jgi:hypothetical protein
MLMKKKGYSSGRLVEVKSAAEILQTLDADGTLDGLPFMPEMMECCGRQFRISRKVEKTCVEFLGGDYDIREFPGNDVVFLESPRCSGAFHDGCQRFCKYFWKVDWLRKPKDGRPADPAGESGDEALLARLKTKTAEDRYFCQSTELARATRTISRSRRVLKSFGTVFRGDVGPFKMTRLVFIPLWRKMSERHRRNVTGSLSRTPAKPLDLQPGEIVEIKSMDEIVQTLDPSGRNRGLQYDRLLEKYSGRRYRIQTRMDSMIYEPTGEMRKPKSTVILENLYCTCENVLGGCPREEVVYWREIWLTRVDDESGKKNAATRN